MLIRAKSIYKNEECTVKEFLKIGSTFSSEEVIYYKKMLVNIDVL